ncbi:NADH dehydrogenase [ubiquinone] 1 beta subcomplex subunit 7, partial [Cucurbita argyrosperma subsp. sororia]
MEVSGSSKKMIATQAEMVEARVPIPYRDQCAHLLIPLNVANQSSTSHGNAKTSAIPSRSVNMSSLWRVRNSPRFEKKEEHVLFHKIN